MSFQNMRVGPILVASALIFGIWFGLAMCGAMTYGVMEIWPTISEMDPNLSEEEQQKIIDKETDRIMADVQDESTAQGITAAFLGLAALVTFGVTWPVTSRNARSLEQARGYGMIIGGIMTGVFLLCTLGNVLTQPLFMLMLFLVALGGWFGGQVGGLRLKQLPEPMPASYLPSPFESLSSYGAPPFGTGGSLTPGSRPETYYSMGVQAALGGRREEARQHFIRVLQMQPRSIAAWLQLANLADAPEQAWNYVQQARSINPTDPAVMHAVEVIWPKVAASQGSAPSLLHNQPPYRGGAQDDAAIPRATLPGSAPDSPPIEPSAPTGDSDGPDTILPPQA
jgi:hypothetical protein